MDFNLVVIVAFLLGIVSAVVFSVFYLIFFTDLFGNYEEFRDEACCDCDELDSE